jgi:type 1 glutamine amidotransferase
MKFLRRLLFTVAVISLSFSATTIHAQNTPSKKIVLIGQGPDHPYRTHCYLPDCELLAKCLRQTPGVEAVVSRGWPEDDKIFHQADAVVLHVRQGGNLFFHPLNRDKAQQLLEQGIGLSAIHWGTGADIGDVGDRWIKALGGHFCAQHFSQYAVEDTDLKDANPAHSVSRGWQTYQLRDEFYFKLRFEDSAIPISLANVKGTDYPMSWVYEREGGGRSFGFVCGHFHDNFGLAPFRQMIVNGILWTANLDIPQEGAPIEIDSDDLALSPEFEKLNDK